jgi:hypothetical protein
MEAHLTYEDRANTRHPSSARTDRSDVEEPLERLLGDYVAHLRERARDGEIDRLWLLADGSPRGCLGGASIMRRLCRGFAQVALGEGHHPRMVQELPRQSTSEMTRKYLGLAKQTEATHQMPTYAPT